MIDCQNVYGGGWSDKPSGSRKACFDYTLPIILGEYRVLWY